MALKMLRVEALRRKMERIPAAVRRQAKADYMLAGREINMLQRTLAPVDSGALRESIRTEPYDDPYIGAFVRAGGPKTTVQIGTRTYDRAVVIGSGDTAGRKKKAGGFGVTYDYALAQELGTQDMDANPFFYTAVRAKRPSTKRRVRAGIKKAIKRAAANG